ncbi:MAG: sarcosine oxidase subunit gamma [Gemmatimonadetes bacterium]|nr:sarcosine oxidase subunit gamma [Gemmatimonadota bacterium]
MVDPALLAMMQSASGAAATLEPVAVRPGLTLRARGAGVQQLARALGVSLMPETNHVQRLADGALLCGLRPDEWACLGDGPEAAGLREAVGADGAVVDTSASRVAFVLAGPGAREVLSSCCALDVRPHLFGVGRCAQTLLGRVGVFLLPLATDRYLIVCRPSHADYVVRWLTDGMQSVR